jgi:uncharacterized protein YdaU (DUF1376 family)
MNLPYFSWYPRDFETDEHVRLMDDCEIGLYVRCLNHAWLNNGLPDDPLEIRRALRDLPKDFSRKWMRVEPCFPISEDGRRRNPRQEKERAQAIEKSSKASASAKRSHSVRRPDAQPSQSERSARASVSVSAFASEDFRGESAERGTGTMSAAIPSIVPVVPTDEAFEPELFENLMGFFIALGRGIGLGDRMTCENLWKGLSQPGERRRAHDYALSQRAEYQARPTGKIPQPWNYLREKHWERDAPRLLAQTRGPTNVDAAHDDATRKFLEMTS